MGTFRGSGTANSGTKTESPASDISVLDTGGNFTADNVEDALAEVKSEFDTHVTELASTANGTGASTVGLEDAAGNLTATDVEAAIAEMFSSGVPASSVLSAGVTYGKLLTADGSGSTAWGQNVWKRLEGVESEDISGATRPTKALFLGTGIDAWAFSVGDAIDYHFHIPHDYAPGTDIYIQAHWGHQGTGISGNMIWDLEVSYAARNAAVPYDTFSTPITTSINSNTVSGTMNITNFPQNCHVTEEIQLSATTPSASQLDSDDLSVDGMILIHMDANTIPTITGGVRNEPFLFYLEIHYQSNIHGTKNKAPNYYT